MATTIVKKNDTSYDGSANKINTAENTMTVKDALKQAQSNSDVKSSGLASIAPQPTKWANTGSTLGNIAGNLGSFFGVTSNTPITYTYTPTADYTSGLAQLTQSDQFKALSPELQTKAIQTYDSNFNIGSDGTSYALKNPNAAGTSVTADTGMTNTTLNAGGALNALQGLAQIGQIGLGIYNAHQSRKALKEAKRQFNKQYQFALQNANNQVKTTNNKIDSSTNIGSSLMGLSNEEAAERLQNAQSHHVDEIQDRG